MKIAVMGYSGSGKTWLTRFLGEKYGIPTMELDQIAFDKHWQRIPDIQIKPTIREFMAQENWAIDGNYDSLFLEDRLRLADQIVIVNLPGFQCLLRALKRSKERAAQGYVNDINPRFLRFLLFDCRKPERRKLYRDIRRNYPAKTVLLRSQRQIDRFVRNLSPHSTR